MSSQLFAGKALPKLPSVLSLDPNIYDPSTRSESSPRITPSKPAESLILTTSSSNADVSYESSVASSTTGFDSDANKYLNDADVLAANKLQEKLSKRMVETSFLHDQKIQQLNTSLKNVQRAVEDNVSVLNDFVLDFDMKSAEKIEKLIEKADPQMSAMEEIFQMDTALKSLEEWLELTGDDNQRDLGAIERAKHNLQKQKKIEIQVKSLDRLSFKHRSTFDALELDDPRLLRDATASAKLLGHYGVKESKHCIPQFLADLKDFETNLSEIKRFFISTSLIPPYYMNKMELLIQEVKSEITEQMGPFSDESCVSSLFSTVNEDPFDYTTSQYYYAPSSVSFSAPSEAEDSGEVEIEVSRSPTSRLNSDKSLAESDDFTLESPQSTSVMYDTLDSTQSSFASLADTVASTQASSVNCDSVHSTQASLSSVSTCNTFDLDCDKTQNSDADVTTAISPQCSSLKTALALHDSLSADSLGSSSTIAI